jgi:hypothetical protein
MSDVACAFVNCTAGNMSAMRPDREAFVTKVFMKEAEKNNLHSALGDPGFTQFKDWFMHDSKNSAKSEKEGGLENLMRRIKSQIDQKSNQAVRN